MKNKIGYMGKYSVLVNIRKYKPKGSTIKYIHNKYYVYEIYTKKLDSGKWGTRTDKLIGYIDEKQGFISNNNYIISEEISTLEYGQYAVVINNSKQTLERLLKYFNPQDAFCIYVVSVLHNINEFVPCISFGYHNLSKILDALGRKYISSK